MPLFRCTRCGCIENTACGAYWNNKRKQIPELCSECDTGTWHGEFEKKSAEGMYVDDEGFLYSQKEVDSSYYTHGVNLVGRISASGEVVPL